MLNNLLLLSGNDIPFEEAQLVIHPPKIKEIAYIGEDSFWGGLEFLNFSKNSLNEPEKDNLTNMSDFEVLMSVIQDSNIALTTRKVQMELVLTLVFPEYHISFTPRAIIFIKEDDKKNVLKIDKDNFDIFKQMLVQIFCLDDLRGGPPKDYNPDNKVAEMLVQKFKKRRQKLAEMKKDDSGTNILTTYASILAVGAGHDLNSVMNYTVFQLMDEFTRYKLKMEFDINLQAKMAGAQNLKDAENWMKNIHSKNIKDTIT